MWFYRNKLILSLEIFCLFFFTYSTVENTELSCLFLKISTILYISFYYFLCGVLLPFQSTWCFAHGKQRLYPVYFVVIKHSETKQVLYISIDLLFSSGQPRLHFLLFFHSSLPERFYIHSADLTNSVITHSFFLFLDEGRYDC